MQIAIDEEYGHSAWIWTFDGTEEELVACWLAGNAPTNFFGSDLGEYEGRVERITEETQELFYRLLSEGPSMHNHIEDDTTLWVGGQGYPFPEHLRWKKFIHYPMAP